jgi:hypothetical protein
MTSVLPKSLSSNLSPTALRLGIAPANTPAIHPTMKKKAKPTQPTGLITIRIVKALAFVAALATGIGEAPAQSGPPTPRPDAPSTPAASNEAMPATEIRAESAVFVAVGETGRGGPESFAIPVSGAARIAEIRQFLAERAAGTERRTLVATCIVALGNDGTNRNYSAPGTPAWGWQVVQLESVRRAQLEVELYPAIPSFTAKPSDIEALLKTRPPVLTDNRINLIGFPIVMELGPGTPGSRLANVSDRGFVGPGNDSKITGFVIEGGAPRSVLIRVLGPTLAQFGVTGTLANPRFEVYRGAEKIAENDDWGQGNLNRPVIAIFPPPAPFHLVPTDAREPALELSLAPGAYTIVVTGVGDTSGIVLTEVHTL